jgi:hypothetical protein
MTRLGLHLVESFLFDFKWIMIPSFFDTYALSNCQNLLFQDFLFESCFVLYKLISLHSDTKLSPFFERGDYIKTKAIRCLLL